MGAERENLLYAFFWRYRRADEEPAGGNWEYARDIIEIKGGGSIRAPGRYCDYHHKQQQESREQRLLFNAITHVREPCRILS